MNAQLGRNFLDMFSLEPDSTFTNHASYGTVPLMVQKERFRLLTLTETNPDRWYRTLLRPLYDEALEELAEFVSSDPKNLVFVQNVTTAVNIIVKTLKLGPEDLVLSNSHTYESCRFAIDSAVKSYINSV